MTETSKVMPIQVGGELSLAERRGQNPVIVKSIPWEMISDEACERQSQINHDQTVTRIAERGGYGACEAICIMASAKYEWVGSEAFAHRILYAMRVLFNRGQWIAEQRNADLLSAARVFLEPYKELSARELMQAAHQADVATFSYPPTYTPHIAAQILAFRNIIEQAKIDSSALADRIPQSPLIA